MKRREFVSLAALASLLPLARLRAAEGPVARGPADESPAVDPYFLESGDLSSHEQEEVAGFEGELELRGRGQSVPSPRGRPKRAPSYRFVRWSGEPGQEGTFQGPLSTPPAFEGPGGARLNAQIVGFQASTKDWKGRSSKGTLSIEFRARARGEALTWLFAKQFDVFPDGSTNLGTEYVAQRDGQPDPVVLDESIVDMRIQLIRHVKKAQLLRGIMSLASFLAKPVVGNFMASAAPAIRIPRLLPEGVALSQAVLGNSAEDRPRWASGFNAYSVTSTGTRMKLAPGYWAVVDDTLPLDLRDVRLVEFGDRLGLTVSGAPADANYLILAMEIDGAGFRDAPVPKGDSHL
jgi:hypothetical protein